ncbi:MAG: creatininase family protein [Candidatus Wukongarchaeota archaeon]|nr:creatininase family protein [Candidatus Wukongarchaeota archaeon]
MKLEEMTWEEVKKAAEQNTTMIIPSGGLAGYGLHLPLGTNVMIVYELALKVAEETNVVVAPPLWYGYEYPTDNFVEVTLWPDHFKEYVYWLVRSLVNKGFKKFILFYGALHNISPLNYCAQKIVEKFPKTKVAVVGWWQLVQKTLMKLFPGEIGHHAESSETSLMLVLRPELCRVDKIKDEMPEIVLFYDLYPRPPQCSTSSGVDGKPSLASKEKGEKLVKEIVDKMKRMIENELVLESDFYK